MPAISIDRLRVGAEFEAMLLSPVLASLCPAGDFVAQYGVEALARSIAAHDTNGFAALVAAHLERTT